jgi:iron complex transport system substrate-binding protein
MKSLIAAVDDKFVTAGKDNQQFGGKKVLLLQGTFFQDNVIATMPGWRTDFLTQMGFVIPDSINSFGVDHRAFIPRNQIGPVLDAADVLIWSTESDPDQAGLLADPNVAALKATAGNHNVFTTKDLSAAIAFSSPLSYPMVAEQLPPLLAKALA